MGGCIYRWVWNYVNVVKSTDLSSVIVPSGGLRNSTQRARVSHFSSSNRFAIGILLLADLLDAICASIFIWYLTKYNVFNFDDRPAILHGALNYKEHFPMSTSEAGTVLAWRYNSSLKRSLTLWVFVWLLRNQDLQRGWKFDWRQCWKYTRFRCDCQIRCVLFNLFTRYVPTLLVCYSFIITCAMNHRKLIRTSPTAETDETNAWSSNPGSVNLSPKRCGSCSTLRVPSGLSWYIVSIWLQHLTATLVAQFKAQQSTNEINMASGVSENACGMMLGDMDTLKC